MDGLFALVESVGHTFGLLALLILVYAHIVQRLPMNGLRFQAASGLLFGTCAIISMIDPLIVADGVVADLRNVSIALSGPFGGPVAAVICGILAAGYRGYEGGAGALAGIAGIMIGLVISVAFARRFSIDPHKLRFGHLLALGGISSLCILSVLLLPGDIALAFIAEAGPSVVAVTICGVLLLGTLLTREHRRIWAEAEVRAHALTDPLTKLPNRRALLDNLERTFDQARRYEQPLTVLFLDIDHFKRINDDHGHDAGDAALAGLADILRGSTRTSDVAGRYGGEEFVVLLPSTPLKGGLHQAERLRRAVEETSISTPAGPMRMTISVGVAVDDPTIAGPQELLSAADEALLIAKRSGRNWVHMLASSAAQVKELRAKVDTIRPVGLAA